MHVFFRRSSANLLPMAILAAAITVSPSCKKSDRDRPGVIEGEVTDIDSGLPLAGVTVRISACQMSGGGDFNCETRNEMKTGADGKYSLTFNGPRSKTFRLQVAQNDSIWSSAVYNIPPGQKTRLQLEARRAYPMKVKLVIRKNDGPQLYMNNNVLRPGPLDTAFNVWGAKNTDASLMLGVQDKTAGYVRGLRKIIPVFPGSTETLQVVIDDMLLLPKFP